jgi:hypothetical protein
MCRFSNGFSFGRWLSQRRSAEITGDRGDGNTFALSASAIVNNWLAA